MIEPWTFGHRLDQGILHREIHKAWKIGGISVRIYFPPLPESNCGRIDIPFFTNDIEFWVLFHNFFGPVGHHLFVWVRIGVHSDPIETDKFNPPDRILDQIIGEIGIALIKIRHAGNKPSVSKFPGINSRSVRILDGRFFVIGNGIVRISVNPIFHRHIFHPPMT